MRPTRRNNSDLLLINSISTRFGHLYAHRQEIQLCSTVENVAWQSQATFSTQCTHLTNRLSSFTTATTGQTTTGSGTQLDILTMGIKMPETCWDTT